MNRLLTKKKGKDVSPADEEGQRQGMPPLTPIETTKDAISPPPKKKGWRLKRGKTEPEPEPKFDITTALPPTDSFRTSLIMANLSTRFSMLRELDDPNSLIGKASDDSVLVQKRRSRFGEYGFSTTALNDISESASLSGSIRPPFGIQRTGSYTYGDGGYGTDDDSSAGGSIMTRARPGEGNMLFGGRQKIYRIPIGDSGSVKNLGTGEYRGMRGRALYEDDVSMSAFQRMREEEKERQREQKMAELDAEIDELRKDSLNSPSFTYSEKRETVSSTNSGPSMISQSTAATSVTHSAPASSPILQSTNGSTKSRRLYEQGLDQHMQEQQSAAIGRLTSMKRTQSGTSTGSGPYHSKSAGNLRDRLDTNVARAGSPMYSDRSATPSSKPSTPLPPSTDITPPSSRPLSPEDAASERDRALYQALNPKDRGMATATGHFNRPKQFNEEQFVQRQMSLLQQQQARKGSTSPSGGISPVKENGHTHRDRNGTRSRTDTNRTDRSWSDSSLRNETTTFSSTQPRTMVQDLGRSVQSGQQKPQDTFFAGHDNEGDSDYGDDNEPERSVSPVSEDGPTVGGATQRPGYTHPALRTNKLPKPTSPREKRNAWSPEQLQSGLAASGSPIIGFNHQGDSSPIDQGQDDEGEDFPKRNGDLTGLVREHLRQASNSSSIYPAQTPGVESTHHDFDLRVPSMYVTENPWEHDDFQPPPVPRLVNNSAHRFGTNAESVNTSSSDPIDPLDAHDSDAPVTDWQEELRKHHAKNASTETAYERRAFNNELAQRQKTIQENLRIKVENEQRTPPILSPTQAPSKNVFETSLRPFGMLRPKSSKEPMPTARDQPRPSISGETDRTSMGRQKTKRADTLPAPPMGRTLHSKLPRQEDDQSWSAASDTGSRLARPSLDRMRPSADSTRTNTNQSSMSAASRPDSSSTSDSRARTANNQSTLSMASRPESSSSSSFDPRGRTGSEVSYAPPSRSSQREQQPPSRNQPELNRPSIDTRRIIPQDSGSNQAPMSAPPVDNPGRSTLERSMRAGPLPDPSTRGKSYPSTTHPPLSSTLSAPDLHQRNNENRTGTSSSNTGLQSTATTPSLLSPLSPGSGSGAGSAHSGLDPQSGPGTGFFFPGSPLSPVHNNMADASALSHGSNKPRAHPSTGATNGNGRPTVPPRRNRKNTISKSDISEPTLIASTRTATTVALPKGASLQNGLRDDFDVVLLGRARDVDPSAPAPSPSVPTGGDIAAIKNRKGWLRGLGRKDGLTDRDGISSSAGGLLCEGEEPEPRRFRIRRLEDGEGKIGHRALRAGDGLDGGDT